MATKDKSVEEMVSFEINFRINPVKYAERFGLNLPDDSVDATLDGEDSVAEDAATVSYGARTNQYGAGSAYGCKATLAECKAKNPMTCRFHGAKAIAQDLDEQIKASFQSNGQQFAGDVDVKIISVTGNTMTCQASITAAGGDEKAVKDALSAFFNLPGVDGDVNDLTKGRGKYQDFFDVDTLNPHAKARWASGQTSAPVQNTAPAAQTPTPAPQPTPTPKRTRTRKMAVQQPKPVAKETQPEENDQTPVASAAKPVSAAPEQEPVSVPEEPQTDDSGIDFPGEDEPVLIPGVAPKEPPPYNPPYTSAELDSLNKMALRLVKTARQINKHIDEGTTDNWLQSAQNNNLPKALLKFKNEIDGATLASLAAKDTDGQVKALQDLMDEILASEANGWKEKVAADKWDLNEKAYWDSNKQGNVDIHFDQKKYDDPYAKEREAFNNYKPGGEYRKSMLESLKQVEDSKAKDAPKDAVKEAKETSKVLDGLEKDYAAAKDAGASDEILKVFGQFYHKDTKKFDEAVKKCKDWMGKQWMSKDTIKETMDALGKDCPDEINDGWQDTEDSLEDAAWRFVARGLGLDVSKKAKYMETFKKNMRAAAKKCTTWTLMPGSRVGKFLDGQDDSLNANCNSYVGAAKAVFGNGVSKWTHYSHGHDFRTPDSQLSSGELAARKGMHIYGVTSYRTPEKVDQWASYGDCAVIVNNREVVKGLLNWNGSSRSELVGHANNCNISFMNDCSCTAVSRQLDNISKRAFTEDLSSLEPAELWKAIGMLKPGLYSNSDSSSNETWIVGGIKKASQIKALKYFSRVPEYTKAQKKVLLENKISVYDSYGKVIYKDGVKV